MVSKDIFWYRVSSLSVALPPPLLVIDCSLQLQSHPCDVPSTVADVVIFVAAFPINAAKREFAMST
jgi:hypothetical protein